MSHSSSQERIESRSSVESLPIEQLRQRCVKIVQEKQQSLCCGGSELTGTGSQKSLLKASASSSDLADLKLTRDDLFDAGLSLDDYSLALYEVLRDNALPNFVPHVEIDQDGGLDSLQHIWTPAKFFWGFFALASVVFNITTLLVLDWQVGASFFWNYAHLCQSQDGLAVGGSVKLFQHLGNAILLQSKPGDVLNLSTSSNSTSSPPHHLVPPPPPTVWENDIFKHIHDPDMRLSILTLASFVATLEVLSLFVLILAALWKLLIFCRGTDKTEYRAFAAVRGFFSDQLPVLATFSAIKLCAMVHPSLIAKDFDRVVQESKWRGTSAKTCLGIYFVVSRIFCGLMAIVAFAVKSLTVCFKLINPSFSITMRWAGVIALLSNCMGCVLLDRVLEDRIFLFMFGGPDAEYQDDERAHRNVYQSRLAREIWNRFWVQEKAPLKTMCAFATLDHFDLQSLLLDHSGQHVNNAGKARTTVVGGGDDNL